MAGIRLIMITGTGTNAAALTTVLSDTIILTSIHIAAKCLGEL